MEEYDGRIQVGRYVREFRIPGAFRIGLARFPSIDNQATDLEINTRAEQKRLSDAARRASEKSKHQAECIPIWEGVILPAGGPREWKRLVRADTKMGELWFEGIPTHLRGRIWSACIGNGLALSKGESRVESILFFLISC